jgi:peptidoglycan/xylan/chitin deacetylase (PgdA/CDA1 family)
MKATFYVNTANINLASYMSVGQLQSLQNNGYDIGSHGHTHVELPPLFDSDIVYQLQTSKQMLQSWGLTVNNYAYPDGARNGQPEVAMLDLS